MKKAVLLILAIAVVFAVFTCGVTLASPQNQNSKNSVTSDPPTAVSSSETYTPVFPAHEPYGNGIGAMPGRVVWTHDPGSVVWDGTGYWWQEENYNESIIQRMVSEGIASLADTESAKLGWDMLFRAHNSMRTGVASGYILGEKIAVKANMNGSGAYADDTTGETQLGYVNPVLLKALLLSLVEDAGVAPSDITVYDASRIFPDYMMTMCTSGNLSGVQFQYRDVLGNNDAVVDRSAPVVWSEDFRGDTSYLPTCVTEADYLINLANLKGHSYGITLNAKNHFGSLMNGSRLRPPEAAGIHRFLTNHQMDQYTVLVDLMANYQLGGKTMLYMQDALVCAPSEGAYITGENSRWQQAPFHDHYTSSIFVSQDPVAIDSVGADFLINEPAVTQRNSTLKNNASIENYLHEAGLVANAPSGTVYYNGGGTAVTNLGVHDHWNNPEQKRYGRNLGKPEGIELFYIGGSIDAMADGAGDEGVISGKFANIPNNSWYAEAVSYCLENRIMAGVTDTRFEPDTKMSRAMLATVLWQMEKSPEPQNEADFTDLKQAWYIQAVNWAAENDIVSGYNNTTFGPEDAVTRQDLCVIISRYVDKTAVQLPEIYSKNNFDDQTSISVYAQNAVDKLYRAGIISGKQGNIFDPLGSATRAETAVILHASSHQQSDNGEE